jgi:leader peptidase (prepilin peptidase)/N-methyltransferase
MTAAVGIGLLVYLTGLCVGSFLNVVVYRLPRGLSLSNPIWSFCPHCQATLRWYDNLPVLGWLLLRGRCRYCGKPIAAQYPLVEAATGLAFVLTYYLLFVAKARVLAVCEAGIVPMAPVWPTDIPLLLAWLILVAVLIACSTLDLLLYVIDTRVTDVALVGGIALRALWPRGEFFGQCAASSAAAAAVAAAIVTVLMMWRSKRRQSSSDGEELAVEHNNASSAPPSSTGSAAVLLAVVAFVGLAVWLLIAAANPAPGTGAALRLAVPAAFLALFAGMVLAGGQPREVDEELRAAIEADAPSSRRAALRELLWLSPAVATWLIVYFAVANVPAIGELWRGVTSWTPLDGFEPVGGAAFAVHGAIVAAAAGWIVRIFFTLAFGREAFGTGDIYILAAAGAVAGWDIALLGFLLSVFIALLGWILGLVLKRPGMIPFGPPLAIGFLVALWFNDVAAETAASLRHDFEQLWHDQPQRLLLLIGIMLVVLPISIVLARLTRRLVESRGPQPRTPPERDDG